MRRRRKDPLRPLTEQDRQALMQIARSGSEQADVVARAREVLTVAAGRSYEETATAGGRRSYEAVSEWVTRFKEGLAALRPHRGGGRKPSYDAAARGRILTEARRTLDPQQDGAAAWSLVTLQRALRKASTYTIFRAPHDAGFRRPAARSWCETGQAVRKRRHTRVIVRDPDVQAKKKLIERACRESARQGPAVWTEDEAGPCQTRPYPGQSWAEHGQARRQPHEYLRNGAARLLTLFRPGSGEVRVWGVLSAANAVLHPWLRQELLEIPARLPAPGPVNAEANQSRRASWRKGLKVRIALPERLPPLRVLPVRDNLKGHLTPSLAVWLSAHGVMPLYTPLSGSWLNMAESMQRML